MWKWTGRALLSSQDKTHTNVFNVPSEQQKAFLRLDNWPFLIPYSTAAPSLILLSVLMPVLHNFSVHRFFSFAIFPRSMHLSITSTVQRRCQSSSLSTQPFLFLVLLSLCLFPSNSSFTVSLEPQRGVRGDR